ncbi:hypothetical protein C8A01DRAFT_48495 [Parachaetomium inaequale]|uniref:Uncharacterized protein n=1 Tax=Parachaetomium inaequale TaxID=2588326 RepID=A0AAN6PBC2_9PEZI|nr:hypothetical protein C8A01DRAFT_48495 [Parachaetomium inaequale]
MLSRPPLSPRCHSAVAITGQSRFVEGSMNDRVGCTRYGVGGGWAGEYRGAPPPAGQRSRGGGYVGGGGRGGGEVGSAAGRYALRRPRSTAGWVRSTQVAQPQQQPQEQRGGVVKKTSFLAPLWDGVREKLHLSKSKSSGSIGKVVNSVVGGGERKIDREKEREKLMGEGKVASPQALPQAPPPAPSTVGYPSREEVLESYKNLVASGFFEAHAIRGGRHPLRTGAALEKGKSFAEHMAIPEAMPSPTRKSFSEHMAAPVTAPSPGRSFADHMATQQKPTLPFSSPTRMAPPPPPRGSSQGKPGTLTSPQRGTKRGASMDLASDAEMVTRKLVKKLRHSASRLSVELAGARDNYYANHGTLRSRPSTSSKPPGPLSPTSSVFSGITSPPSIKAPAADDTMSIRHGRLTKPKDGRRRRILGLTRRHRSPAPATTETDPDAMMIDEPEQQQQPPKLHRITTPPPAAFRTHYPRGLRASSTSGSSITMSLHEHEPLSVVPDPNQGIPFVPRIPREFCDAMAALVPPAAAATPVVVVPGEVKKEGEDGKGKNGNRDSGLGEDVENIPVWG